MNTHRFDQKEIDSCEFQTSQFILHSSDCVSKKELTEILQKSIQEKKPLIIKAGFDPTYPDLHLGHLVLLKKLKLFQDLGHQVCFLVGDFTAQVGDPSGQNEARPQVSPLEIQKNVKTYTSQVFKVLDKQKTKILYNSQWISKIKAEDWVSLCSSYTVSRMLEREDFSQRLSKKPIYIHEFLYPLLQGYDSYCMKSDLEIGGSDQIFNLLMGRTLQKYYQQKQQCVLTYPLLEGLDGKKKMSKSLGNFIALNDIPKEMYGKIMSLSDDLMVKYYELLTDYKNFKVLLSEIKKEPLQKKKDLAFRMVQQFHGLDEARLSQKNFEAVFSQKKIPQQIPEITMKEQKDLWIGHLLKNLNMAASTGEARRLIQNGGVRINSEKVLNTDLKLNFKTGDEYILQTGKRKFLKIRVEK